MSKGSILDMHVLTTNTVEPQGKGGALPDRSEFVQRASLMSGRVGIKR